MNAIFVDLDRKYRYDVLMDEHSEFDARHYASPLEDEVGYLKTVASLHHETLARVRDYIVEGNLPEGARIPERQLCEMLGISRTPLREALKVLSAEGLIELLPNRGARVKPLNARDLRELFDVMGGLEALAGRLACEFMTTQEFEDIELLHHKMYTHYLRRELPKYFQCNQMIHQKIVSAARSTVLQGLYSGIADRLRRVRYSANLDHSRDRWSEAMREHEAILDALRRRAGDEVGNLLFQHLRNKFIAASAHILGGEAMANTPAGLVNTAIE